MVPLEATAEIIDPEIGVRHVEGRCCLVERRRAALDIDVLDRGGTDVAITLDDPTLAVTERRRWELDVVVDVGKRGSDHGAGPIARERHGNHREVLDRFRLPGRVHDIARPVGDDPTDGDVELTSAAVEPDHLDPTGTVTAVEKGADRHA